MKYLQPSFTITSTTKEAHEKYRQGWVRTFGKGK